jgi:hypothetical protein
MVPTKSVAVQLGRLPPRAESDYRCRVCGYEIAVPRRLPACPMCRSSDWLPVRVHRSAVEHEVVAASGRGGLASRRLGHGVKR